MTIRPTKLVNDNLLEFIDKCMAYDYPKVSQEHLKMRIFGVALKDKAKEWFISTRVYLME